jgi:hypothetical protein
MGGFFYFGILVILVVTGIYIERCRNQPKEIGLDEVPELVREEAARRVPTFVAERAIQKRDSYKLVGQAEGKPLQVKIRLKGRKSNRSLDKIQIQLETRSSYRSLKGKHLIEQKKVPKLVMQRANEIARTYVGPLDEIIRVKAATVQGRNTFDIKGWSGNWRVEVELLDDGELLEVELKPRTN